MKTYEYKEQETYEHSYNMKEKSIREKFEEQLKVRKEIEYLCNELKVDIYEINPWQLRLSQNWKSIDIFPHKNMYHVVGTIYRGKYNNITGFMYRHFI
jgi:hypothetical protein